MDSSVSPKDEIWFLRVCHHISTGLNLWHQLVNTMHFYTSLCVLIIFILKMTLCSRNMYQRIIQKRESCWRNFTLLLYCKMTGRVGAVSRHKNTFKFVIMRSLYRVSQEECARLRESVPYVKLYRYNPKHLYPKLNGYGDNGQRSLKLWQQLLTYWLQIHIETGRNMWFV